MSSHCGISVFGGQTFFSITLLAIPEGADENVEYGLRHTDNSLTNKCRR